MQRHSWVQKLQSSEFVTIIASQKHNKQSLSILNFLLFDLWLSTMVNVNQRNGQFTLDKMTIMSAVRKWSRFKKDHLVALVVKSRPESSASVHLCKLFRLFTTFSVISCNCWFCERLGNYSSSNWRLSLHCNYLFPVVLELRCVHICDNNWSKNLFDLK